MREIAERAGVSAGPGQVRGAAYRRECTRRSSRLLAPCERSVSSLLSCQNRACRLQASVSVCTQDENRREGLTEHENGTFRLCRIQAFHQSERRSSDYCRRLRRGHPLQSADQLVDQLMAGTDLAYLFRQEPGDGRLPQLLQRAIGVSEQPANAFVGEALLRKEVSEHR